MAVRITLIMWICAATLVVPVQAQTTGSISGHVTDASTGHALPGASVVLGDLPSIGTVAGRDGRFTLDAVPPGTHALRASLIGYRKASLDGVVVEAGETVTVSLALQETSYGLDEVVVQATRMTIPLSAVSGAVTVVDAGEIAAQATTGNGLGDVLGKLVPGLGVSTGSPSIYGQSLRGRTFSVMIDGVPQSTTRNTSRDLATIDPSMVDRVEVIRGATAIYGDGATGGIVNIITRRPTQSGLQFTTDVAMGSPLSSPGDGLEGRLAQSILGSTGKTDYTATLTLSRTSGFYDAEGSLIPPDPYGQGGLASTTSYGLQAKAGYNVSGGRIQLAASHYSSDQETAYVTDPSVDTLPAGEAKAVAIKGLSLDRNQGSWNTVASLDVDLDRVAGGRIHAQIFFREYLTRFSPFDGRPFAVYRNIIQSYLDSQKVGGRLEYERVLSSAGNLTILTGIDYTDERTQQPVGVIDSVTYDASGGLTYRTVDERPWVPLMNPRKAGLFAQFSWRPIAVIDFQGGARYEPTRMHIDDFTTLIGNNVHGGSVDYDPFLVNAGAVVHTSHATSLYASFSQGFSLTDLGLLLRNAADGFVVGNRTLKAQKVDNYELGARVATRPYRASLAAFYNESALGTTSAGLDRGVVRAPERVYGIEATLDVDPHERLTLGGTFTWTEGEHDPDEDGTFIALNSFRIQPVKLTTYLEHRMRPGWTNRLQVLYSGDRDRAHRDRPNPDVVGFGEREVESYLLVDLTSAFRAGPGTFKLGIHNLLNAQYYPVVSQLMWNGRNSSRAAAPGARLLLGYTVTY